MPAARASSHVYPARESHFVDLTIHETQSQLSPERSVDDAGVENYRVACPSDILGLSRLADVMSAKDTSGRFGLVGHTFSLHEGGREYSISGINYWRSDIAFIASEDGTPLVLKHLKSFDASLLNHPESGNPTLDAEIHKARSVMLEIEVQRLLSTSQAAVNIDGNLVPLAPRFIEAALVPSPVSPGQLLPFLVMERLNGKTLDDRLSPVSLSLDELLSFLRHGALGLNALHENGVAHLDSEFRNLMVQESREAGNTCFARWFDFGDAALPRLARLQSEHGFARPVRSELFVTSVLHEEPGPAADIRIFGAAIFDLIGKFESLERARPVRRKLLSLSRSMFASPAARPSLIECAEELQELREYL